MRVIKPPEFLDWFNLHRSDWSPTIFLAGSIEMGKAVDWQSSITENLENRKGTILNPRRDDWDSSWKQTIGNIQFRDQVEWELDAQEKCDIILMNFCVGTQSPITLLELGLFKRQNIVVLCPRGFWKKGNVDVVCKRYGIPQVTSFKDLIKVGLKNWKNGY